MMCPHAGRMAVYKEVLPVNSDKYDLARQIVRREV